MTLKFKAYISLYYLIPLYILIFSLFSNRDQWSYSSFEGITLLIFLCCIPFFLFSSGIDYLLRTKSIYLRYCALCTYITIFILFTFLPTEGELLDGQFHKKAFTAFDALRILSFPLVFCGLQFFRLKKNLVFQRFLKAGLLSLTFITFGLLLFLGVLTSQSRNESDLTDKEPETVAISENKNVFLLFVETLQGDMVNHLLTENKRLYEAFDGFSFFPNSISPIPHSPFSVAALLHGDSEFLKLGNQNNIKNSLRQSSIFKLLESKQGEWRAHGYGPHFPDSIGSVEFLNRYNAGSFKGIARYSSLLKNVFSVSVRRVIPVIFWDVLERIERKAFSCLDFLEKSSDKFNAREAFQLWTLKLGDRKVKENVLHFNFNYMSHVSVIFEKEGTTNFSLTHTYQNQLNEFHYTLSLYTAFLDKLREMEIYDSSSIIIVSDHGSYFKKSGVYNNALFVKLPFSKGPMRIESSSVDIFSVNTFLKALIQQSSVDDDVLNRLVKAKASKTIEFFLKPKGGALKRNGRNYSIQSTEDGIQGIESYFKKVGVDLPKE